MSWRTERSAERYTVPPLPVTNSVAHFCNHYSKIVTHNLRRGVTQRHSEYTLALARWAAYRMALDGTIPSCRVGWSWQFRRSDQAGVIKGEPPHETYGDRVRG